MDKEAAARIQATEAHKHGGEVPKGGFAARAQVSAHLTKLIGVIRDGMLSDTFCCDSSIFEIITYTRFALKVS